MEGNGANSGDLWRDYPQLISYLLSGKIQSDLMNANESYLCVRILYVN